MKKNIKSFIGKWSIIEMSAWDQDYVNMEVPGHFTFNKDGTGYFQFGLVQGEMDFDLETVDGHERVEFSWAGRDEMEPASGRGWTVVENNELYGRIFFHQGDDSTFRAKKY